MYNRALSLAFVLRCCLGPWHAPCLPTGTGLVGSGRRNPARQASPGHGVSKPITGFPNRQELVGVRIPFANGPAHYSKRAGAQHNLVPMGGNSAPLDHHVAGHTMLLWGERSRAAKNVFLSPVQPLYGMTQFKFTSCMSVLYINKIKVIIKMGGYLGVSGEIKGRTLMSCDTRQWQCLVELRCTVGGRRLSACSTQRDGFGCTDPPIWLRLDPSDHAPTAAQTYVRWRRVTTSIPLRLVRCDIVSPTRGFLEFVVVMLFCKEVVCGCVGLLAISQVSAYEHVLAAAEAELDPVLVQ